MTDNVQDFKRELSQETGTIYYGDGGTIHGSTELSVEVNSKGEVVSVWFRCLTLPFHVFKRDSIGGATTGYASIPDPGIDIVGIDYRRKPE
jgi:hypothetical protein